MDLIFLLNCIGYNHFGPFIIAVIVYKNLSFPFIFVFIYEQCVCVCRGDLIIATDGKPVRHVRDVLECIGLEVGKVIEMKVLRRSSSRSSSGSSGSGGGYFNWGYGSGSGSDSGAASNNNYDVITLRVKSAPESR